MIARPLDLASRLRPPPHGTGALHYVNVGLLGLRSDVCKPRIQVRGRRAKMIARPLDLASRLRPPPHGTGALHYVNVGLLGLFFSVFGSRFVLAPGLGVDFQLPQLSGARADASPTTSYIINVLRSGQIFTEDGLV